MPSVPLADDPVWTGLPDGVDLITDGDEVAGFAFEPDADVDVAELNRFLVQVGAPLMDEPED